MIATNSPGAIVRLTPFNAGTAISPILWMRWTSSRRTPTGFPSKSRSRRPVDETAAVDTSETVSMWSPVGIFHFRRLV